MIALIDGDVVVYAAGFASDANAKRKKKEVEEQGGDSSGMPDSEPVEFCLHGVDTMLEGIMKYSKADSYQIVLSHEASFREAIFPEYKANRDSAHKPVWHKEIKAFLKDKRGALISAAGDEADDALGIWHTENPESTIICTVDKDLDMIPGNHYNWSKTRREAGTYIVSEVEANRFFYTQMLTGDGTDNIPGMFKVLGKMCMAKHKAPIQKMTSPQEMFDYVLDIYEGNVEFVTLSGRLLWVKRHEGKEWYDELYGVKMPVLEAA